MRCIFSALKGTEDGLWANISEWLMIYYTLVFTANLGFIQDLIQLTVIEFTGIFAQT